jgi:hypothetical protein
MLEHALTIVADTLAQIIRGNLVLVLSLPVVTHMRHRSVEWLLSVLIA